MNISKLSTNSKVLAYDYEINSLAAETFVTYIGTLNKNAEKLIKSDLLLVLALERLCYVHI